MLIGEVSRRCGVSTRMLRHYDALGLVTPSVRTASGYREYSADDIRRLFHVECLRTLGLSLTEAKRALDDPGFAPGDMVEQLVRRTRARIAAEQELLRKLERVDAAAPEQWEAVLSIVTLLHALDSESGADRQQAVLAQYEGVPVDALVAAALSEEDLNVAGALRWSLARAADAGLPDLTAGLDSPKSEVRRRAVEAIAAVPTAEATAALRRALDDADVAVRDRAALALGSRRVAEAMPHLLEMVTDGRTDVEAAEMLGLLAETAAGDIVGRLRERLVTDDQPTRLRITQALGEIPVPAARQVLTELTGDGDRWVAATAAAILRGVADSPG
ncbi:HEAT repeat domain-containing protein [Nocardia cyriacigeorgica]|uniref:HEAT repeat domain-containing protein n=1 Tax=Nocardia cyriacigeorgica TaxID=135487 RepID=UPI0002E1A643|nr:HEAT repeat domain-containing protein [Nocardia cyriacigeorgica]AVH24101.1 MerR family DNA-binding transcriptional regulator [Nocardia cyriacigeorgica]MBF6326356.1 HEAT repeat domain-containing protein [Nocardia cyriacigeorgica]MBF6499172.1 HEAT repeat domain-containing protein [Nocardia cyriacigeorgica]PPJ05553.1 MerR family DNA-binding transcriptional regulator [Nocardia cyriacigeorgica]TLF59861.1 MerR family transcriptional regulator [Nocardia cyriacigeorgica]